MTDPWYGLPPFPFLVALAAVGIGFTWLMVILTLPPDREKRRPWWLP